MDLIGPDGQVRIIERGRVYSPVEVRQQFRRFIPLSKVAPSERGWTTLTLSAIRTLSKRRFTLKDLYDRELQFGMHYPDNKNIRAKIRQQLQVLRDFGLVRFDGRGEYTALG